MNPHQFFWLKSDGSGDYEPARFGKLYSYRSETTIPKPLYSDEHRAYALPNPVVLDAQGCATFFLDRRDDLYRLVLEKTDGSPVFIHEKVRQW